MCAQGFRKPLLQVSFIQRAQQSYPVLESFQKEEPGTYYKNTHLLEKSKLLKSVKPVVKVDLQNQQAWHIAKNQLENLKAKNKALLNKMNSLEQRTSQDSNDLLQEHQQMAWEDWNSAFMRHMHLRALHFQAIKELKILDKCKPKKLYDKVNKLFGLVKSSKQKHTAFTKQLQNLTNSL